MRALGIALLALHLGAAPPKLPPEHRPDPKTWRLEVGPELGGWVGEPVQTLSLKLVDPKDPDPPKLGPRRRDEGEDFEGEEEGSEEPYSPERLAAERKAWEEYRRRTAWRDRSIRVWFNGQASVLSVQVGYPLEHTLRSQPGENRLELLEPDSGIRIVRTWWASGSRIRLSLRRVWNPGEEWGGGRLEVLEPGGEKLSPGRRSPSGGTLDWESGYSHPTPPPGTYTLRWGGGWRGGKPFRVRIEGSLDAGTDRERRFSFERLFLPGSGTVTLGTLDVED